MGIIFAQLDTEQAPRHLVGIEPTSTVAEAADAVRAAFKLRAGGELALGFAGRPLADPGATLADGQVPADAVIEAASR